MLDQNFCNFLEDEVSKKLANTKDLLLKGFWCDGVLLPDSVNTYSLKSVNDNRQIKVFVFTGITGQDQYELLIKFGNKALSRYARNLDIKECLPTLKNDNWLSIDIPNKKMEIQLL